MIIKKLLLLTLIFTSTLFGVSINAYNLAPNISVLEDGSKRLTLEKILENQHLFEQNDYNFLYFHFQTSAYWLKFDLNNKEKHKQAYILEIPTSWLDRVELYQMMGKEFKGSQLAGDRVLLKDKTTPHRNLVFPLSLDPQESNTIYLRIESQDALNIPVLLYTQDLYKHKNQNELLLAGVVIGIFMVIIFFSAMVGIYLKDMTYIVYGLYALFFLMMNFSVEGFALHLVWQDWLFWNEASYNFFLMGYLGFSLLFMKLLVDTKRYAKRHDTLLTFAAIVYLLLALLSFVIPYPIAMELGVFSAALIPFISIVPVVAAMRHGNRLATIYIIGWVPNLILYSVWAFAFFGLISVNVFTSHANVIGVMVEMLVLTYALAFRIDQIHREKQLLENDIKYDPLTKVYNRRYFREYMDKLYDLPTHEQKSFAFVMIDLDYFKQYNDTYGHQAGDQVLINFAKLLRTFEPQTPMQVFRMGGEEFALVMEVISKEQAYQNLLTLYHTINKKCVDFEESPFKHLTASIGYEFVPAPYEKPIKEIYKEADEKLYEAKEAGRNQIK
jgi:diguanylate cyclase (GGDEF)-like protein